MEVEFDLEFKMRVCTADTESPERSIRNKHLEWKCWICLQ